MTNEMIINKLNDIHSALLKVHKTLLQLQIHDYEVKEQKKITPNETINLAISHPDFLWLKELSNLILEIDDLTLDKNKILSIQDLVFIQKKLISKLFETTDSQIKTRIEMAHYEKPNLKAELEDLKLLCE